VQRKVFPIEAWPGKSATIDFQLKVAWMGDFAQKYPWESLECCAHCWYSNSAVQRSINHYPICIQGNCLAGGFKGTLTHLKSSSIQPGVPVKDSGWV